jgi:SPP1 family predicted phage head-tail adaptor
MPYRTADILRAGDMTARITLSSPTLTSDEDEISGFTPLAENVPASKRMLRGRELLDAGRDVSEQWTEFRIRYRDGLDSSKRLTDGGRHYDIESIDDPTGARRVLLITAKVVR